MNESLRPDGDPDGALVVIGVLALLLLGALLGGVLMLWWLR